MGNNVYLYCMHACTQNHVGHSLSVLILDVAMTVFLLYIASMLVSGYLYSYPKDKKMIDYSISTANYGF